MSTSAFVTMVVTEVAITLITIYFFWKVLKTPPKPEPDSYQFNDEEER
jgi:hypothetical protein